MDYPVKLASQLRPQLQALRKQRGLTQAQLGALIGVTQARVVEIEANPGAVSLQQVMQVLQALGAGLVIRDGTPEAVALQAGEPSSPVLAKKGEW